MSKQRLVIILISALVLCLSFFGLNVLENNVEAAVLKDEQINLYISGPQKMVTLLENEFEKEHGDVLNVYHTGVVLCAKKCGQKWWLVVFRLILSGEQNLLCIRLLETRGFCSSINPLK